MTNLRAIEIKAFIPARDFEVSKQFYRDLGFTMASDGGGVAYFHFGHVSFLLQDDPAEQPVDTLTMHLLVEDVEAWLQHVRASGVIERYAVTCTNMLTQAWRMRDFCLHDPSGVVWCIAQNCD
jgi:catechol 2,3-dioxygenase-like lactoylglutathione lyase family enzyme